MLSKVPHRKIPYECVFVPLVLQVHRAQLSDAVDVFVQELLLSTPPNTGNSQQRIAVIRMTGAASRQCT
jgi:hypothetical protein